MSEIYNNDPWYVLKKFSEKGVKRRHRKYRSIDDPWEDSSEVVILPKPAGVVAGRLFKPAKRYFHNVVIHDESGSMGPKVLEVGEAIHKLMMQNLENVGGSETGVVPGRSAKPLLRSSILPADSKEKS